MKVAVEDVSSVKKIIRVEIPESEVTGEVEKAYATFRKSLKLKGFRQGKVPRSIIEKRFKTDVQAEVSGQLIQKSYPDALRQAALAPVGEPAVDRPDLQPGRPYNYSVTVEVKPVINDLNINGLKLKKKLYKVTDEELESQLKVLQKSQAHLKTVDEDRPVEKGDIVVIDYEGFKDGKPFKAVSRTENFLVEVGSGRILKDFDDQLVGMRANTDKEFSVRFPSDYFNKELAGLDVLFKVDLKEIKEEILPEIDDEFAKDLGEHQTLAGLKQAIAERLEKRYESRSEQELRHDVVDLLIEQADFELPDVLLEHELSALVEETRNALAYRGLPPEDVVRRTGGLFEKYRPLAERKVREYLLLQKVVEQEGITATDEMLEQEYNKMAEATNNSVEVIKQFHAYNKEAFEVFKHRTIELQAIRTIIEKSALETIEVDRPAPREAGVEARDQGEL